MCNAATVYLSDECIFLKIDNFVQRGLHQRNHNGVEFQLIWKTMVYQAVFLKTIWWILNIFSRPFFTIIFKSKMVISSLVHL